LISNALKNLTESIFSSSRLKRKFLRFFFIAGFLPLFLMGMASMYLVNRTHRIDVANLERTLISQQAAEIEKFISEAIGLFQLQVGFKEYAEIALEHQHFLLERMLEANSYLDEVAFISLGGKETSRIVREKGLVSDLRDRSKDKAFNVAKEGRDYFGPVKFGPKGPQVTVASRVLNRENQIISVLAGEVNLKPIQESLERVRLGNTGYLYIVDGEGKVIAHSQNLGISENIKNLGIVGEVLAGVSRNGLSSKDIYVSQWGKRVIGAGNLLSPLGWAMIAEWPLDDAQQVVGMIFGQLFWFSLAAFLLVIALAGFVSRQLMRPISLLKEGAARIGEGKFDYRISVRTGDEIEELGHSLNKMAVSLSQLEELHEIKLRVQYLAEALAKEKELSKIKDQFITTASHQLLTPLSVMGWSVESLKGEIGFSKSIQESIAALDKSRKDLLLIAQDLLTISEIGFSYKKAAGKIISLEKLVRATVEKFKNEIELKNLHLTIKVSNKNTDVNAEEFILGRAIEQLLDNAITYSHEGGNIMIALERDENEVRFSIRDEGIGIPKDEHPLVFKEFFRARNAVSKKNVGTGLGLFIVKTIIEGHGGKIGFESEEGKGSTFYFSLPAGDIH
jgi:signal transduction histidine kinase